VDGKYIKGVAHFSSSVSSITDNYAEKPYSDVAFGLTCRNVYNKQITGRTDINWTNRCIAISGFSFR
jgi:hypothetical protein